MGLGFYWIGGYSSPCQSMTDFICSHGSGGHGQDDGGRAGDEEEEGTVGRRGIR